MAASAAVPRTASSGPGPSTLPGKQAEFLLAEYKALRDEILKRLEMQHQLISFALAAAGGLFAAGIANWSAVLPLLYPLLALLLAVAWNLHDIRISELGVYIRDRIEVHLLGLGYGWEQLRETQYRKPVTLHGWHSRGALRTVFAGTQVLAVGLALAMASLPPPQGRRPIDVGLHLTYGPTLFGVDTTGIVLALCSLKVEVVLLLLGLVMAMLTCSLPNFYEHRLRRLREGYPMPLVTSPPMHTGRGTSDAKWLDSGVSEHPTDEGAPHR